MPGSASFSAVCKLPVLGWSSQPAKTWAITAGVWAAALGKTLPAFPKGLWALVQPRWFQFEAYTQCWSCIEFLPWNQQNLLQHFAWIKIFVPFFFTGQKEDSWSLRRKEIITGPYRSRSCATAAHSLRGRNRGPQTWNTTLSKCLWAAQEKHPPEAYLITMICNRLNVCSRFLRRLHLLPRANEMLKQNTDKFNEGDLIVCVKANMVH